MGHIQIRGSSIPLPDTSSSPVSGEGSPSTTPRTATYRPENPGVSRQEGENHNVPSQQLNQIGRGQIDGPTFSGQKPSPTLTSPQPTSSQPPTSGSTESAGNASGVYLRGQSKNRSKHLQQVSRNRHLRQ
jgi:hypothetical protein